MVTEVDQRSRRESRWLHPSGAPAHPVRTPCRAVSGRGPKGRILIGSEAELEPLGSGEVGAGVDPLELLEASLARLERARPEGLASAEILQILSEHGVQVSEATLRKYVQLGLLPRSVRVGRKGKHLGSRGLYPTEVVRRIALIKALMAERLSMDEIRRRLAFLSVDIDKLEASIQAVLTKVRHHAEGATVSGNVASIDGRRRSELRAIERLGRELIERLRRLDARLRQQGGASGEQPGAGAPLRQVV
jgi:DNA-binding transcriptional MerR regulator